MTNHSSLHVRLPADPADRRPPVRPVPRPAEGPSRTSAGLPWAGKVISVRSESETVPALVWTVDRELRASFGLPGSGLDDSGSSLFDRHATRDPDHPAIRAHRLALTGESVSYEMEWEERLWEVRIEPLRDAAGAVTGCFGVAFDVTARRYEEEALFQENEHLHATLASIGDGVIRTDRPGADRFDEPGRGAPDRVGRRGRFRPACIRGLPGDRRGHALPAP